MRIPVSEILTESHRNHPGYVDEDYPAYWDIGELDDVTMYIHNTMRYEIDSEAGAQDFANLMPSGEHQVFLGPDKRPFTIAMFHQLKCLDIVRRDFINLENAPLSDLGNHCLNYLYQTVLCHANTRLEPLRTHIWEKSAAAWEQDNMCKDWEAVYNAAEDNWAEYQRS